MSLKRFGSIIGLISLLAINTLLAAVTDTTYVTGLIEGVDDHDSRQNNFDIINNTIDLVGRTGGGIVKIPQGTYYIGPNLVKAATDNPKQAIRIAWSNITFCGAGMDKTTLKTNGTFVDSAYVSGSWMPGGRGNGIWIIGTDQIYNPTKNIVIKDFELDGQAGHNGNYILNYQEGTAVGWDMWHKGIFTTNMDYVDSVTIENIEIHNYRGEVLYGGGDMMGKLHIKNIKSYGSNASTCNVHASEMLVEDSEFGKDNGNSADDCRFWIEWAARQYQSENKVHKTVFRNNTFRGGQTNIALCQGDYKEVEIVFDNNDIDANGHDVFESMGGVYGPVRIINNTISNAHTVFQPNMSGGGVAPGAEKMNSNVYIEGNTITNAYALLWLRQTGDNIQVRNNTYSGESLNSYSITWDAGIAPLNFYNNIVEENTFSNCRYPQHMIGYGEPIKVESERPLHRNNVYNAPMNKNEKSTPSIYTNVFNITSSNSTIFPHYEEAEVGTDEAEVVAALNTESYPDGQEVKIYGGTAANRIKFATGQPSYVINEDIVLDAETDTIVFKYVKNAKKWIEKSSDTYNVESVSLPESLNIEKGDSAVLIADVQPAYAMNTDVTWSSDAPAVASVNENGLIMGLTGGTANIIVTSIDGGFKDTCVVTCVQAIEYEGNIKKVNPVCGGGSEAKVFLDPGAISGGSGKYVYSMRYQINVGGIWRSYDVVVDDPLFGSNNIQASPEFQINGAYGTITFVATIYDSTDISLTCTKNTGRQDLAIVMFAPKKLEMTVNKDDASCIDETIAGTITVDIKGGNGGTYSMWGDKLAPDGNAYRVVVSSTDGSTKYINNTLDDIANTSTFDAPNCGFVINIYDQKACNISETVTIVPVGVDDIIMENNVTIYPNPGHGNVYIQFENIPDDNTIIRVFNHTGRLVAVKQAFSQKEMIDLSGRSPGLYIVNITDSESVKTLKLLVK